MAPMIADLSMNVLLNYADIAIELSEAKSCMMRGDYAPLGVWLAKITSDVFFKNPLTPTW